MAKIEVGQCNACVWWKPTSDMGKCLCDKRTSRMLITNWPVSTLTSGEYGCVMHKPKEQQ